MRRIILGILLLPCAKPSGQAPASAVIATAGQQDGMLRSDLLTRVEADQAGRLGSLGANFALLTDRVATARGRPQVYGSQADIVAGHVVLKPIADSAGVDARRARVGLPPLTEYIRVLDSLYTPRRPP